MILRTGNNENGFSFLEVMMALVILSVGIIAVYQIFMASLGYQQYTTNRLYALHVLNTSTEEVQLKFEAEGAPLLTPPRPGAPRTTDPVHFTSAVETQNVRELGSVLKADVRLSWGDNNRKVNQSRMLYLFRPPEKEKQAGLSTP